MDLKEYFKDRLYGQLRESSIFNLLPGVGAAAPAAAQTTGTPPDPNGIAFGTQDKGRGPDRGKPVTQAEAIYAQEVARYSRPGGATISAGKDVVSGRFDGNEIPKTPLERIREREYRRKNPSYRNDGRVPAVKLPHSRYRGGNRNDSRDLPVKLPRPGRERGTYRGRERERGFNADAL